VQLFDPTPAQRRRLERWRVSTFWVMLVGYIGYYIGRGNLSVAMPLLSKEFGYSNEQLGIILTISELAYAVGKFTTGPLADKIGGRAIFLAGLVGAIAFNLLFPLSSTILMFTIVWSCCRYFLSMGWGGIVKTIGEWFEPERNGTVMGLISINFQFGSVVATVFCGYLVYLGAGWKGLFFYPAGVMSLIAIWAYFASRQSPHDVVPEVRFGRHAGKKTSLAGISEHPSERNVWSVIRALLRIRMFRQLLGFSFVAHMVRSIFLFWTPKFLVDMGMGTVAAAMTSAIFPLLGCVGTIFLGWYTDRYAKGGDRARAMWIMLIGLALSFAIVAALVPYRLEFQVGIIVFLAIAGFCLFGPYSMSAGCLSLDIAGSAGAGTCSGMLDGVGYIGAALATWGTGVVADRLGWSQVFWMLSGCAILASLSAYGMSAAFRRDVRERRVLAAVSA